MSSDLSVKINKIINVNEMLINTENVLKEILRVSKIPKVSINILESGEKKPFSENQLGFDGQFFLIGFEGYTDGISLIFSEVQLHLPYITEEESGIWVGISVGINKSPIEFALAASIAIVFAKIQMTEIIDNGCVWNKYIKQKPEDFQRIISLNKIYCDLESSAKAMFDLLNFGREKYT